MQEQVVIVAVVPDSGCVMQGRPTVVVGHLDGLGKPSGQVPHHASVAEDGGHVKGRRSVRGNSVLRYGELAPVQRRLEIFEAPVSGRYVDLVYLGLSMEVEKKKTNNFNQ